MLFLPVYDKEKVMTLHIKEEVKLTKLLKIPLTRYRSHKDDYTMEIFLLLILLSLKSI